jgi:hypothetical protein
VKPAAWWEAKPGKLCPKRKFYHSRLPCPSPPFKRRGLNGRNPVTAFRGFKLVRKTQTRQTAAKWGIENGWARSAGRAAGLATAKDGTAYGGVNVSLTVVVNHSYKNACEDSRAGKDHADTCDVATKSAAETPP